MDNATLQRLYLEDKLSARQIADSLGESEARVAYWLERYKIPKRSISEAIYNRINRAVDPFEPKRDLTVEEEKLKAAGLTLWVTEGSLRTRHRVFSSNSDPSLISIFLNFLRTIAGVRKEKIQLRILYYPNMDLTQKQVLEFWMSKTGLASLHPKSPKIQLPLAKIRLQESEPWLARTLFGCKLAKSQIKIDHYKATHNYRAKSKYGTATLYVDNIKLRKQMQEWLEELVKEIGE